MSENQAQYKPAGLPAERAIEYTVSGQTVRLTPAMVRQFLVHGKSELVTDQEIVFFMHICRARGLNPFNKDCYLVKYTSEPAAIIVSIDKLRYQARKSEDCVGWKSGVIVQKEDGTVRYSNGLILEGEKLLGGWFEGKPRGWEEPFRLEVNLSGYVKRTKEGATTRFWAPENQPTMIAKVAEAQGLRRLWPEQIQGLYLQEELSAGIHDEPPIEIEPAQPAAPPQLDHEVFGGILGDPLLERFISVTADKNHSTREEVIQAANSNPDGFIRAFGGWKAKQMTASAEPHQQPAAPDPAPRRRRREKAMPRPQSPPTAQGDDEPWTTDEPPSGPDFEDNPREVGSTPAPSIADLAGSPDVKGIHPVGTAAGQALTGKAPLQAGDDDNPERAELEALRAELRRVYAENPGHLLQAQRNLNFAIGAGNPPPTVDGCRVLLEEVERLKAKGGTR